jgi:hypothetical protein
MGVSVLLTARSCRRVAVPVHYENTQYTVGAHTRQQHHSRARRRRNAYLGKGKLGLKVNS